MSSKKCIFGELSILHKLLLNIPSKFGGRKRKIALHRIGLYGNILVYYSALPETSSTAGTNTQSFYKRKDADCLMEQFICQKLLDMMEERPYDRIKVTELVKYAGLYAAQ